jgi:transposase
MLEKGGQFFNETTDPAQRRHNMAQLHSEGWSVASIAEYFAVSKQTVYTILKRWVQEGVKGFSDKSHGSLAPRVVTLEIANEIRKKQENPLIGEWRMHDALLQEELVSSQVQLP